MMLPPSTFFLIRLDQDVAKAVYDEFVDRYTVVSFQIVSGANQLQISNMSPTNGSFPQNHFLLTFLYKLSAGN